MNAPLPESQPQGCVQPTAPPSAFEIAARCAAAGWHVFPIKAGAKTPLTPNGFKDASQDSARVAAWGAQFPGCNWAVACGASDLLVVDADPRNGADVAAVDALLPPTLSSATGGGGRHWFFRGARRVPKAIAAGVDLKSEGGYVLLPGSATAPATRTDVDGHVWGSGPYSWILPIHGISDVPQVVLDAIAAQPAPIATGEVEDLPPGLELGPTWAVEAAADLSTLPVAKKGDGGAPSLRAAAVAIRGWLLDIDTADEVLRTSWCPRCEPPWTFDDAGDERNWWHTLQRAADIGSCEWGERIPLVGLDMAKGPGEVAAARAVQRDDGVAVAAHAPNEPTIDVPKPPFNMTVPAEAWVSWMNSRFTVLTALGASGMVRVMSWINDTHSDNPRQAIVLQSKDNFLLSMLPHTGLIEGKMDENGAQARTRIAPWWLQRFDRAEASRVCFRPDLPPGCRVSGQINLWRGYGIVPKAGDWSLLREHLRMYAARENAEHFAYIMAWMAWVVQNPGKRAEVVLVFKGIKGSGKNTAFDSLCMMLGQHGKAVANPQHFTGKFNAHLLDCALLFANEAIPPNDKGAEGVLKALVTDSTMPIERKGVDIEYARNCLSVCMASNERWCVPASLDERRFAVYEIDPRGRRGEDPDEGVAYWEMLHAQLDAGGRAAMLYDLLELDLRGWHPRRRPPKTEALVEQQVHGLRGADAIVQQMLSTGDNWGFADGADVRVPAGCTFVATTVLAEFTASREGVARRAVDLAKALQRACGAAAASGARFPITHQKGRWVRGYVLPPLAEARALWTASTALDVAWPNVDGWT